MIFNLEQHEIESIIGFIDNNSTTSSNFWPLVQKLKFQYQEQLPKQEDPQE
jgi:transposase